MGEESRVPPHFADVSHAFRFEATRASARGVPGAAKGVMARRRRQPRMRVRDGTRAGTAGATPRAGARAAVGVGARASGRPVALRSRAPGLAPSRSPARSLSGKARHFHWV